MLVTTLLADTLAVLLALGSLTFYIAAFFYPEVHRRSDFVWGGLGFAYALVLWVGAGQMTWVVLLGQLVAVVLLLGLGWQTLTVRREKTPVYQQTPISLTPEVVGDWAKSQLNQLRIAPVDAVPVRLEKRASGSPRQDPRRRPAYEYEFVEDGLLDALEEDAADVPAASFTEMTPSVPPSVDAEIISVEAPKTDEIPEAMVVGPETRDDMGVVEDGAQELGAVEPELTLEPTLEATSASAPEPISEPTSEEPVSETTSEESIPEPTSEPVPESAPLVASDDDEQIEAAATPSVEQDEDDWGDDFFEDDNEDTNWADVEAASVPAASVPPAASVRDARFSSDPKTLSEPSPERAVDKSPEKVREKKPEKKPEKKLERAVDKTREKPSLLATPVILAGWVKDVVASLTRPKPSKPMIEIPRREPARSQPASPSSAAVSGPGAYTTSQSVENAAERSVERAVERATERTADRDAYQNDRAEPMADFSTDDTDDTDWEESNWDD